MHYFVEFLQTRYHYESHLVLAQWINPKRKKGETPPPPPTWSLMAAVRLIVHSPLWMKDIATRVIARELNLEETPVSKVMTRNPTFVLSDTLAVEALQKMVQGW